MKEIHIAGGLLSIAAGAVALYAAKGSTLHRKSGMVFVIAMVVMTTSAWLAAMLWSPNRVNVAAASLTFYMVCTALLTVRRTVEQARVPLAALMLIALAVGIYDFRLGLEGLGNANGLVDKVPAQMLFVFGAVALLAASLDARLLWAGSVQGAHRLARHLWRMTFAMWVATGSLFMGQPGFFPEPLRQRPELRAIPFVLVTLLLFYWLARVLIKRERAIPRLEPVRSSG